MSCRPHLEEAPARDFLAIYSQTRLRLETSFAFKPQGPKSYDSCRYSDESLGLPTRGGDPIGGSSQTRLRLVTSFAFKPQEPKSDDSYRIPMTRWD